ncbi:MAG: hypothetical protein K9K86_05340 [Pseudomonadales bacterium]|nr:hypothetical protein [Pseudomonadales bacterium]
MNNFQDQLGKLLNLEQLQESVKDFYDPDTLMSKIQVNVKLASKLIEANTSAASDAVIMQSVKLRDGVETALKQADTLICVSRVLRFTLALRSAMLKHSSIDSRPL